MVAAVWSDDINSQLEASHFFAEALWPDDGPVEEVIQSGVVPRFVEFLTREDSPKLQVSELEAAWVLTNMAAGVKEHAKVVIENGAVPNFIRLLSSPNEDVREQAVWALGNVAYDSTSSRDLVLSQGALNHLLQQLKEHDTLHMRKKVAWTLSILCKGKPPPPFEEEETIRPTLDALYRLVHSTDEEVLKETCSALLYITNCGKEMVQAVIKADVCPRLCELLLHSSPSVLMPTLATVREIVAGDNEQTQCIIDNGALPCLLRLLSNDYDKKIKHHACGIITLITAGNPKQTKAVIDAGLLGYLVKLLQIADFVMKREAAWAISNAANSGNHEHVIYLVDHGCIKPLCDLLACRDQRLITVCLEAIGGILGDGEVEKKSSKIGDGDVNYNAKLVEEAGGLRKIKILKKHDNSQIADQAVKIIRTYWTTEKDESFPPSSEPQPS